MVFQENILGLVDAGREPRRAPLVGVQFLHERSVRVPNGPLIRPRLKAKDLVGLLFGHRARSRRAAQPRTRIALSVFTPAGVPAVKISFE